MVEVTKLYRARFPESDRAAKARVWRVLCADFFQAMILETDAVLDLGAGFGEFLGNIRCGSRTAVEIDPGAGERLPAGTRLIQRPSWELDEVESGSMDVVFASNFFEHLPSKDRLLETLAQVHRVLRPGGRLLILQPNLAYLHGRFFDFLDHHLPLTHNSMTEALVISGFTVTRCIPRFLPFTTRSRLPQTPWLVRLYLKFPPAWLVLGKQMFIRADKTSSD